MAHEAYSPVGYSYQADDYCLDCILDVVTRERRVLYIQDDGCNCTECLLDRIAGDRGIDRYDEHSFDSSTFPKAIPYHNDIHAECGPEEYGYGPEDPEWREQYCGGTCARCHEVIDGIDLCDGSTYRYVCPAWLQRKENDFR